MLVSIAWQSLKARRKTVMLTFISLLISLTVLLSVEHIRSQAKESFNRTVSGIDMIVGAPSGQLNLLLYSVFRLGSPVNEIQYQSFINLKKHKDINWAIPIALGDSHKGYRVLGTNNDYFNYYQYGDKQKLAFKVGQHFRGVFDAVLGAEVAKKLNYHVGDQIIIAHGIGSSSFSEHQLSPFVVSGILAPTGTPLDKTVHVTLAGIEAVHLPPAHLKQLIVHLDKVPLEQIHPKTITSVMLSLKSKFSIFTLQRAINQTQDDRLMAILPGVAMTELWLLMGTVENILRVISFLVLISSLIGLCTMLLASMQQRASEFTVLRIIGAGPASLFLLILIEAFLLLVLSVIAAIGVISLTLWYFNGWLSAEFGLFLSTNILNQSTFEILALIFGATLVTACLPAYEAYQQAK
ncbi:ABC transporter permease [Catenovulum sp. 2E275]|uniref:ABC transporter permease n=1 Tax=Catenovulum sp. 2E275 TaxID=2980497 RepID=UPI0021D136F6|nr:ABC transporter permease [Catenovulum sp. 2E275]MCU4674154.1 ABC transporter permease [Catenovulum sp. 2E275]